jgi:uncharacterized protein
MKFPMIAARSYQALKGFTSYRKIVRLITSKLRKTYEPSKRARYIYSEVDKRVNTLVTQENFSELIKCKEGCSSCCHTQVSVTKEEATLLGQKVIDGLSINWTNFYIQAKAGDNAKSFYQIPYEQRACIFLNKEGSCRIYDDRPSVCRTNLVVSNPELCSTRNGQEQSVQLVKTFEADMVVYASFLNSRSAGSLPRMVWQHLSEKGATAGSVVSLNSSDIEKLE